MYMYIVHSIYIECDGWIVVEIKLFFPNLVDNSTIAAYTHI